MTKNQPYEWSHGDLRAACRMRTARAVVARMYALVALYRSEGRIAEGRLYLAEASRYRRSL